MALIRITRGVAIGLCCGAIVLLGIALTKSGRSLGVCRRITSNNCEY